MEQRKDGAWVGRIHPGSPSEEAEGTPGKRIGNGGSRGGPRGGVDPILRVGENLNAGGVNRRESAGGSKRFVGPSFDPKKAKEKQPISRKPKRPMIF